LKGKKKKTNINQRGGTAISGGRDILRLGPPKCFVIMVGPTAQVESYPQAARVEVENRKKNHETMRIRRSGAKKEKQI